ncbi:MAG: hypothetical protein II348_06305 [Clostridia bacterium]|nr:hypothetical protein [Clostridia bacterium]
MRNVKKILVLLLAALLCFAVTACGTPSEEEVPEISKEELSAMTDDALIAFLLDRSASYREPQVFEAEMSYRYTSGDATVTSMAGTVRSNGIDRIMTFDRTVGDTTKSLTYIYKNGTMYWNDGGQYRYEAESAQAAEYFAKQYPSFGTVSSYGFARKDLLRSEDGDYHLVLSSPANGVGNADLPSPLALLGENEKMELSSFSDVYLSLWFSSEGALLGQSLGLDCKMTNDGVITEGTVLFRFAIRSVEPVQNPISEPDNAESYTTAKTSPFEE